MSMVVTQPCFGCKHTDCVVVCPFECFHEGQEMLFIDPECCTECDACVPECPVDAIYHEDNVPEEWHAFIQLNEEMSKVCPQITERKPALNS